MHGTHGSLLLIASSNDPSELRCRLSEVYPQSYSSRWKPAGVVIEVQYCACERVLPMDCTEFNSHHVRSHHSATSPACLPPPIQPQLPSSPWVRQIFFQLLCQESRCQDDPRFLSLMSDACCCSASELLIHLSHPSTHALNAGRLDASAHVYKFSTQ
jgi:hypothetical protein